MLTDDEKDRLKKLRALSCSNKNFSKEDTDFLQYCYDKDPEYYRSLIATK